MPQKTYLDANGKPIRGTGTYLSDTGDIIGEPPPARDPISAALNVGGGVVMGALSEVPKVISGTYHAISDPPSTSFENTIAPPTIDPFAKVGQGVALAAKRLFVDPQTEMFQRAAVASREGETLESLLYRGAGAVPFLGPMLAGKVEQAQTEGIPEAVGASLTDLALMNVGPKSVKKGVGALDRLNATRPARLDANAFTKITKVLKPSNKDFQFERNMNLAVPEIAEQARIVKTDPKNPVPSVTKMHELMLGAKERLRGTYEQYIAPYRDSIEIDGATTVGPAIRKTITAKMRRERPAQVKSIEAIADRYSTTIRLPEAETLLENVNRDLATFYRKDRLGQANAAETQTAARNIALAETLRKEIYNKVNQVAGPGIADIQRRYGAIRSLETYTEPLHIDIQRFGGKNIPAMASETAADVAAGGIYSRAGALVRGGRGIIQMIKPGPDENIASAFRRLGRLQANTPTPTPKPNLPQLPMGSEPIVREPWMRVWEPPAARVPGEPLPPTPSDVIGFSSPWGDLESQLTQGSQRLLPATGETTPLEAFINERSQFSTSPRTTTPQGAMQPRQLMAPTEPGVMRETVQTRAIGIDYPPSGFANLPATGAGTPMMDAFAATQMRGLERLTNQELLTRRANAAALYPRLTWLFDLEIGRRGLTAP